MVVFNYTARGLSTTLCGTVPAALPYAPARGISLTLAACISHSRWLAVHSVLFVYCVAGNGNRARALQAGAVPALEAALSRFPAEASLQTQAKGAIDKIKAGG